MNASDGYRFSRGEAMETKKAGNDLPPRNVSNQLAMIRFMPPCKPPTRYFLAALVMASYIRWTSPNSPPKRRPTPTPRTAQLHN